MRDNGVGEECLCERANERPFIICDHICIVVTDQARFEIGKVEACIVICFELVNEVKHYFVGLFWIDEFVYEALGDALHLLVRTAELIELKLCFGVDRDMWNFPFLSAHENGLN